MTLFRAILAGCLGLALTASALAQTPAGDDFKAWLAALRQEAIARGIRAETFDRALAGVKPDPRVIELDRRQPEFLEPFLDYLERRVTARRVEEGRRLLDEHRELLAAVQRRYGIPPHVLVALWGLETNYGGYLGDFVVPAALATLAYEPRRSQFFRAQLLDALAIIDEGHVDVAAMKGSWAGAMGHMQFMPSTFRAYAVDGDGDGRKDLWGSLPDAFASAANYLSRLGWQADELWGREVRLPANFDWEQARLNLTRPVSAWAAMGVTQADGSPLPSSSLQGAIVLPQGHKGPAFLVYGNFNIIMNWNRSVSYALAVGLLSDRLRGLPGLQNGQTARHPRLSRQQIVELQRQLDALGFEPGEADGIPGGRTRAAIKAFQRQAGLPVDGYASPELLARVEAQARSRGLLSAAHAPFASESDTAPAPTLRPQ